MQKAKRKCYYFFLTVLRSLAHNTYWLFRKTTRMCERVFYTCRRMSTKKHWTKMVRVSILYYPSYQAFVLVRRVDRLILLCCYIAQGQDKSVILLWCGHLSVSTFTIHVTTLGNNKNILVCTLRTPIIVLTTQFLVILYTFWVCTTAIAKHLFAYVCKHYILSVKQVRL